jgi:hypothetical protein
MLQAHADFGAQTPDADDFPSGAYRVRFLHSHSATQLGSYLAALTAGGKYVLPYIEVESTYPFVSPDGVADSNPRQSDAAWDTKMRAFATALAAAGVEFIEFSNEPNRPGNLTARHRLWGAYADRLGKSAPIFRGAGVGVMLTSLGPSAFNEEWMRFLASTGKVEHSIDAAAIHCYSGGKHAPPIGTPNIQNLTNADLPDANGTPQDTLQRTQHARAALDVAFPSRPELDVWITESGWPSYWAATPDAQPGILDPSHQTYSTPAQQATKLGDLFTLLMDNEPEPGITHCQQNRCRMVGWFHSTDYRDGTTPDYATLAAGYTWPGSGTIEIIPGPPGFSTDLAEFAKQIPDEPNTLTNGTQVVNYTGTRRTGAGTVADPYRYWIDGLSGGSGTWAAATQVKWDTPGNWAHHHGIRYELGTPRVVDLGSNHKQSWAEFEAVAGIGRGTAGEKPMVTLAGVAPIEATRATVKALINPKGKATEWRFSWGKDKNLDNYEAIQSAGSGSVDVEAEHVLSGLDPETDYFYRYTAWNEAGLAWSEGIGGFKTEAVPEPEPPPVVSAYTPYEPLLSYSLVDDRQKPLASLVNRRAGSSGQVALNGQRTATVELAVEDPDAALIEAGVYLKVKLRNAPLFIGRLVLPGFNLSSSDISTLTAAAVDPSFALVRNFIKFLRRDSTNYVAPPLDGSGVPTAPARRDGSYFVWAWRGVELEQAHLLAFLIECADASPDEKARGIPSHGIKRGTLQEGPFDRISGGHVADYSTGKNTWEALTEIADLENAVDFELEPVDADDGTLCLLNTFYPRQGTDKHATVELDFGLGRNNVQALTYQPSGETLCNRFIAVGKADRRGWASQIVAENAVSQQRYGVLEDHDAFETRSIDRLRAKARAQVAARAFPVEFVDATILDEDEPGALRFGPGDDDDFWLGDVVTVRAREPEGLDIAPVQRVTDAAWIETEAATIEWTLTLADSTLSPGITDFQTVGFIDPEG